jgi:hypothetical protein
LFYSILIFFSSLSIELTLSLRWAGYRYLYAENIGGSHDIVAWHPMETPNETQSAPIPLRSERNHAWIEENGEPSLVLLQGLKPTDRGWDAWVVLIAGFVFEALFWG